MLSDAWFRDLKILLLWGLEIKLVENYFFLKNYVTLEGAVSQNILYYQQLSIPRNQVGFYANNSFEYLPIMSTAFNTSLQWFC